MGHPRSIVFLGDSITHQGRYLRFLAEHFAASAPGSGVRLWNAGVGGDRTDLCLARLARDVDAHRPERIMVLLGMNDCMDDAARAAFESHFAALAARLKRTNPQAAFLWATPTPYDSEVEASAGDGPHPERAAALERYAAFIRAWQKREGGTLVDFHSPMVAFNRAAQKDDPAFSLCGPDRVHPQEPGGYFMARVFLRDAGFLPWREPESVPSLEAEMEKWRESHDTPACREAARRADAEAEGRTLHMIRWQLEVLQHRDADDFGALEALERSFGGRHGEFEDRVRRYLREWPRTGE